MAAIMVLSSAGPGAQELKNESDCEDNGAPFSVSSFLLGRRTFLASRRPRVKTHDFRCVDDSTRNHPRADDVKRQAQECCYQPPFEHHRPSDSEPLREVSSSHGVPP